jgi:hypothetical protein
MLACRPGYVYFYQELFITYTLSRYWWNGHRTLSLRDFNGTETTVRSLKSYFSSSPLTFSESERSIDIQTIIHYHTARNSGSSFILQCVFKDGCMPNLKTLRLLFPSASSSQTPILDFGKETPRFSCLHRSFSRYDLTSWRRGCTTSQQQQVHQNRQRLG